MLLWIPPLRHWRAKTEIECCLGNRFENLSLVRQTPVKTMRRLRRRGEMSLKKRPPNNSLSPGVVRLGRCVGA